MSLSEILEKCRLSLGNTGNNQTWDTKINNNLYVLLDIPIDAIDETRNIDEEIAYAKEQVIETIKPF